MTVRHTKHVDAIPPIPPSSYTEYPSWMGTLNGQVAEGWPAFLDAWNTDIEKFASIDTGAPKEIIRMDSVIPSTVTPYINLADGRLLCKGAATSDGSLHIFDPLDGSLTSTGRTCAYARGGGAACLTRNGDVLFLVGSGSSSSNRIYPEWYSPSTNTIMTGTTSGTAMGYGRQGAAIQMSKGSGSSVVADGQLLVTYTYSAGENSRIVSPDTRAIIRVITSTISNLTVNAITLSSGGIPICAGYGYNTSTRLYSAVIGKFVATTPNIVPAGQLGFYNRYAEHIMILPLADEFLVSTRTATSSAGNSNLLRWTLGASTVSIAAASTPITAMLALPNGKVMCTRTDVAGGYYYDLATSKLTSIYGSLTIPPSQRLILMSDGRVVAVSISTSWPSVIIDFGFGPVDPNFISSPFINRVDL